ncbi:MAG TPA: glycosyltransferase [Clostridiaceae bacterium]|nr:glycosyltransferase [Clostridiaceae bacterium]
MKLLSIVVPCYNSQEYMRRCIDSLLPGGEEVEILIINDGSKDDTASIADEYGKKYPALVKVIHQENKGHGGALNTGIQNASGMYLKVVDSDDWVDYTAYIAILEKLRELLDMEIPVDMLISNYVYEKADARQKTVIQYRNILPENRIFTWDEMGTFRKGKYIIMHSIIYKTDVLRASGLKLPEHTFYVDNLFAYIPLTCVKTMYYMNVNFYRYFIGRENQSVNEKVMISRIDQQIKVNKLMFDLVDLNIISNKNMQRYMFHYLEIITIISSVLLIRSGTRENLLKKRKLWDYIKKKDYRLYFRLRNGLMGTMANLPGRTGRLVTVTAYKLAQKVVGFN